MPPDVPLTSRPRGGIADLTPARLLQGCTGVSTPIQPLLDFQLAHARARDAVHSTLDIERLKRDLAPLDVVRVKSRAVDRESYLRRPDLGRSLSSIAGDALPAGPFDVVFVVADGLSAEAAQCHAAPVLREAIPLLQSRVLGPIVVAEQARVALADEIGATMRASLVAILLGERPGLSSPHSLGIYVSFGPTPGMRNSQRNCISNIHHNGLGHAAAARALVEGIETAFARKRTGVMPGNDHSLAAIGSALCTNEREG